jgi:putative transposase
MSNKYKFNDNTNLYFVSFAVVYWIDLFIRNEYHGILLDSHKYCQRHKGLDIYAWCIMTSHVHLIIGSETNKLQDIMRDFKAYTSHALRKCIEVNERESRKEWMLWMMKRAGMKNSNNKDWQLWQQDSHPIQLFNAEITKQKLDYLHNNPVVAGFVNKAEEYVYSSAADYYGKCGLLDIRLLF